MGNLSFSRCITLSMLPDGTQQIFPFLENLIFFSALTFAYYQECLGLLSKLSLRTGLPLSVNIWASGIRISVGYITFLVELTHKKVQDAFVSVVSFFGVLNIIYSFHFEIFLIFFTDCFVR